MISSLLSMSRVARPPAEDQEGLSSRFQRREESKEEEERED